MTPPAATFTLTKLGLLQPKWSSFAEQGPAWRQLFPERITKACFRVYFSWWKGIPSEAIFSPWILSRPECSQVSKISSEEPFIYEEGALVFQLSGQAAFSREGEGVGVGEWEESKGDWEQRMKTNEEKMCADKCWQEEDTPKGPALTPGSHLPGTFQLILFKTCHGLPGELSLLITWLSPRIFVSSLSWRDLATGREFPGALPDTPLFASYHLSRVVTRCQR